MIRWAQGAVAAFALCGCAAERKEPALESPSAESLASDGRDMAEAQCSGCHAVGTFGDSPNPAAPPFRGVLSRYDSTLLEENLINGIQVAHPMPEFQFNPKGVDALIAYLRSIDEASQKTR